MGQKGISKWPFSFVNNLKRDPLEIQHPKFESSRLSLIESVHEIIVDVTSLMPPSPGLSVILFPNESVEPCSPNGRENIKITTLYRYFQGRHMAQ